MSIEKIRWDDVPLADFNNMTNAELAKKYGVSENAASCARHKHRKNGLMCKRSSEVIVDRRRAKYELEMSQVATPERAADAIQEVDTDDPLRVFKSEVWGEVRTVKIDGEVWFVGRDVAEILGYSNSNDALIKHVNTEDKLTIANRDGKWGASVLTIINMTGVICLVARSKMPDARKFQRWLFGEVVPTLMRDGSYAIEPTDPIEALLAQNDRLSNSIREMYTEKKRLATALETTTNALVKVNNDLMDTERQRDLFRNMTERVEEPQNVNFFAKQFHKNGKHLSGKALNRMLSELGYGSTRKINGYKRFEPYIEYVNKGWYITRQYEYKPGKYCDIYELTNLGRQAITEVLQTFGYQIGGSPGDTIYAADLF